MDDLAAPHFLYTFFMLASALGGFAVSLAPRVFGFEESIKGLHTIQRLGEAHVAGLFLGVALCHMLDSALDHYASFKRENNVQTDYPMVPMLVGVTFCAMVVFETLSNAFKEASESCPVAPPHPANPNGGCGPTTTSSAAAPSDQPSASKAKVTATTTRIRTQSWGKGSSHAGSVVGTKEDGMTAGFALLLASVFTLTTPIALLASAAWGINQNHLLTFVIQSIACGTFLYLDFEAVSAMRAGERHGHSCGKVDATRGWKATVAVILMSGHAVFDGFAISTSTGDRAGVICFAITVHKFWVAIALGTELQKALPRKCMHVTVMINGKKMAGPKETDPLVEMKDTRVKVHQHDYNSTLPEDLEDSGKGLLSKRTSVLADIGVFLLGFGMLAAVAVVM